MSFPSARAPPDVATRAGGQLQVPVKEESTRPGAMEEDEEVAPPPSYRPGDMVWAKLGRWRFWPATVLDPAKHQAVDKAATAAAGGKVCL